MVNGVKILAGIVGGLLAVWLLSVGLFVNALDDAFEPIPESIEHRVDYEATFQVNGTVEDVRMMMPFPEGQEFAAKLENSTTVKPEDWNLSTAATDRGSMMVIEADRITPYRDGNVTGERDELGYQDTYDIEFSVNYNRTIDTRNGLETEPRLPTRNREDSDRCMSQGECYSSTSDAYLNYSASDDAFTYIDIDLEGRNSWFSLGWTGNFYSQELRTGIERRVSGSQSDWVPLNGTEEQGVGNYRD